MPSGKCKANQNWAWRMRSTLSSHSRVSYVKWISKATSLGYAGTFNADHKIQIAIVA